MSFDDIVSKIVSLNKCKNSYAEKKLKGDADENDEKDMISSLIYLIAELRKTASEIGISEDGKLNSSHPELEKFMSLNENVKNLKSQILLLINSSTKQLKEEMLKQSDKYHSFKTEEDRKKSNSNTELSRRQEVIERLRNKLEDSKIEDEDEKE